MTEETQKLTAKELYRKLKPLLAEVESLNSDIKDLLDEGKEADLQVALIKALAAAHVKGTLSKVEEKAESTIKLIDELEG